MEVAVGNWNTDHWAIPQHHHYTLYKLRYQYLHCNHSTDFMLHFEGISLSVFLKQLLVFPPPTCLIIQKNLAGGYDITADYPQTQTTEKNYEACYLFGPWMFHSDLPGAQILQTHWHRYKVIQCTSSMERIQCLLCVVVLVFLICFTNHIYDFILDVAAKGSRKQMFDEHPGYTLQ